MDVRSLPGLPVAELTPADIPAAMRLVEEARWNQVAADWELFVARGGAMKVVDGHGAVVATAAVLPYAPGFGWISMVLVTQAHRRRGIASGLLQLCVQRLRAQGLVPVLDATPAGREVYRPLGFRDGWPITRWRRAGAPGTPAAAPHAVRALRDDDWAAIAALDQRAFGADRLALLRALQARSRAFSCVVEREGRIAGYLLGRDGRVATQLGPIVTDDPGVSASLLAHALARVDGPVLVDVLDRHTGFARLLEQAGFAVERPYIRMPHAFDGAFGDAGLVVAIAGPELG